MAADPRHPHHRSKHLGTAAKQTNGLGDKAQANGFYVSQTTTWGRRLGRRGPSTTAGGSDASNGWKRGGFYLSVATWGRRSIIIIIEASNLNEGQGLEYQPLREPYTVDT